MARTLSRKHLVFDPHLSVLYDGSLFKENSPRYRPTDFLISVHNLVFTVPGCVAADHPSSSLYFTTTIKWDRSTSKSEEKARL